MNFTPSRQLNRTDYAKRNTSDLVAMRKRAEDRLGRADTMEDAMTDEFQIQEIGAVLSLREGALV